MQQAPAYNQGAVQAITNTVSQIEALQGSEQLDATTLKNSCSSCLTNGGSGEQPAVSGITWNYTSLTATLTAATGLLKTPSDYIKLATLSDTVADGTYINLHLPFDSTDLNAGSGLFFGFKNAADDNINLLTAPYLGLVTAGLGSMYKASMNLIMLYRGGVWRLGASLHSLSELVLTRENLTSSVLDTGTSGVDIDLVLCGVSSPSVTISVGRLTANILG